MRMLLLWAVPFKEIQCRSKKFHYSFNQKHIAQQVAALASAGAAEPAARWMEATCYTRRTDRSRADL